jgi:hypothetical protein
MLSVFLLEEVAVIVAVPVFCPVINPSSFTFTILGSEELHVTF